jgi:hypothetical protein
MDIRVPSDVVVDSDRYAALTPEQFSCFYAMWNDVCAVASSRRSTAADGQAIITALQTGAPGDWGAVVRAVYRLLGANSAGPPRPARARLEQFIAENADLLRSTRAAENVDAAPQRRDRETHE